jgi:hypothetical protein
MAANRPTLPLTGGCSCGAIRYEVAAFPLLLYACHCTDCQSASGSAFALNMPVAAQSLRIVRGRVKGWHHRSPSGAELTSWFCGDCGARIYGERDTRPETMNLRAGTLDDTSWLAPVMHMFVGSAQDWLRVATAAAECHDMSPPDFGRAAATWRALWPEFFPAR